MERGLTQDLSLFNSSYALYCQAFFMVQKIAALIVQLCMSRYCKFEYRVGVTPSLTHSTTRGEHLPVLDSF